MAQSAGLAFDFLTRSCLLFAFLRADGWVIVEQYPIRASGWSCSGPVRRRSHKYFDSATLRGAVNEGQSWHPGSAQDLSELECLKVLEPNCTW
ncbi:MAG: hypothetical protein EG828_03425 [Deltaproteobacteria bacterium]|nr:hypothetical protein [Deltaproteobacteria bacterium]